MNFIKDKRIKLIHKHKINDQIGHLKKISP